MQITAAAERTIDAPAAHVYNLIRDFQRHHPRFLPPQFGDLEIEHGGIGAGTIHSFTLTLGGRTSAYRVRVGEPQPGRVLVESDPAKRMLTTFTVDPLPYGRSRVGIHSRWYAHGVAGLFERLVAPLLLKRVYREELRMLDGYARGELVAARVAALQPRPWASAR